MELNYNQTYQSHDEGASEVRKLEFIKILISINLSFCPISDEISVFIKLTLFLLFVEPI